MRRFLPLLAQCAHSSRPYRDDTYDHVLVDEAQDVTPLEWRLLTAVNPKHSWTLLGDMNQRRSDWTYHSWTDVGVGLGITQAGQQLPPDVIERGYRTTAAIMQFAAKLLPRAQRTVDSLQSEGTPPQIHRVKGASVHEEAVTDALRLHSAHPHGTIAIIGTDPRQTARALRLRGFTTDPHNRRRWVNNAQKIWVLSAEDARGLEFDAVVIVEPAEFPMNYGRHGLLYTSLTRANRDLVIVHRRPLPDALRKGHRSK
jgi:DNA helicase IV